MALGYQNRNNAENSVVRNKLITFATCVNNSDPKRAGRIRAIPSEGENVTITIGQVLVLWGHLKNL